jgi:hypothetical protein
MNISQVVAETGDRLIGLAPMLGLTCKSFYKFRVLKSLGAAPVCLKHVTRPADDWSRVTISNVAVHVPALAESAERLSPIRWELDFLELRAFLDGRPEWPKALKDVEVRLYFFFGPVVFFAVVFFAVVFFAVVFFAVVFFAVVFFATVFLAPPSNTRPVAAMRLRASWRFFSSRADRRFLSSSGSSLSLGIVTKS